MGVISGHQLSTFTSPVNATSPIDANTVRGNDNTIKTTYNAHDADTTIHLQNGAVSSRPSASTAGQMWLATDTGAVVGSYDTGSAWVSWNYVATNSTGAATITSTTSPILTLAYDGSHTATFGVSSAGLLTINATTTVTITPATTITGALTLNSDVQIHATGKLYLDGGVDTYLVEVSDGTIRCLCNATAVWDANTQGLALDANMDFRVNTTRKIYLNGGTGTTYITEPSANQIQLAVSSAEVFRVTATQTIVAGELVLSPAASKIVPGATSLSLRNTADGADNLLMTDAGLATFRGAVVTTKLTASQEVISDGGNVTALNTTATTFYTPLIVGVYLVSVLVSGGSTNLAAHAVLAEGETGGLTLLTNNATSANIAISISGANLQVTQSSGSSQTVRWRVQRVLYDQ